MFLAALIVKSISVFIELSLFDVIKTQLYSHPGNGMGENISTVPKLKIHRVSNVFINKNESIDKT